MQFHQGGRFGKAEAIYQQLLQIQPNHPDILHLRGLANHQLGNHEVAYPLIKKAISINPLAAHYHNNLGEVCRSLNRSDEALDCYAKALSLQPMLAEAHRNIGLVHLAAGKTELAVSTLSNAMGRFPECLGLYWALGMALMSQNKASDAIAAYTAGLEKSPTDPALLCAKGIALKATGQLAETIQHYQHAIALQPQVPELHHNLALIHQQLGNYEAAISCLEKELELTPRAESAKHLLAALQNTTTDRAPASYVRETFDSYAEGFDHHLVSRLEYHVPATLASKLASVIGQNDRKFDILDLGCGTGLFGEHVKALKKRLTGIDLSPKMIEKAGQRQIYDQLIVGDLLDYLRETEAGQFDLIAATDVFIYVGDLLPVFEQVSRILPPAGFFIFSIEAPQTETADFVLSRTGRYQHHKEYLTRLAAQFELAPLDVSESCLRKEKDHPVTGYLYLLRKIPS